MTTKSIRKVVNSRRSGRTAVPRRARSDAEAEARLDTALRHGDSVAFLKALEVIVREHRYATVAKETGFNRTWLYHALSRSNNLGIRTVVALLSVLGLRLRVERIVN